jgi:DNA excision repair protein ERCC-3
MSVLQARSAFSYVTPKMEVINAWAEEPHHFRVPRNYLSSAALGSMPFPVYDARFKSFPRVNISSLVKLDSKEPTKTYQQDGSDALLATHDGVLCLRCGAGKTVVGLHSAAQLKVPILIMVTNKGLARQWMDEITQFLGVPTEDIGRVGGDGSPFDWEKPITVAMVQTIASRVSSGTLPAEMTRHFGVILCDEAHLMGAPYFNTAVPPFHGRRWGLSATPNRDDGFDSLLRYTIGSVVYSYLIPDLKPTVFFKRLPTRPDFAKKDVVDQTHDVAKNLHFGMLYSYFASDCHDRTDEIVKEVRAAVDDGRQVLVLTHSRAMCELLGQKLPGSGVCHGGVKEDDRIRHIRECNPVVAIMQLGKEALNKPSLDTLFVCEPFTKKGALQQTMGRVLRAFSGKKSPIVVFFEDVHIRPLLLMCNKIRQSLIRWPSFKGGSIPFKIIKVKE